MPRAYNQDPLQGRKFRVSIPGLPSGVGFTKISGLSQEIGVVEYDEGAYDYTHKLQGKVKTGELVCEKGLFANTQIESLMQDALTNPNSRKTVVIELMDKTGKVARKWTLAECWASKWEVGDIDASSEDPVVETITLQYEYFM